VTGKRESNTRALARVEKLVRQMELLCQHGKVILHVQSGKVTEVERLVKDAERVG